MILLVLVFAIIAIISIIVMFTGILGELTGNGNKRMIKSSFIVFAVSMILMMVLSYVV